MNPPTIVRVLTDLVNADPSQSFHVPVGQFQSILAHYGVDPGTELSDHILLCCQVDQQGLVDYSVLYKEAQHQQQRPPPVQTQPVPVQQQQVQQQQQQIQQQQQQIPQQQPQIPQQQPQIPQQQPQQIPQQPPPPQTHPSPYELSGQLRQLFNAYDTGRLGINQFKAEILNLGLPDSPALKSLFRHTAYNMTFAQLMKAVTQTNATEMDARAAGDVTHCTPDSDDVRNVINYAPSTPVYNHQPPPATPNNHGDTPDLLKWKSNYGTPAPVNSPLPKMAQDKEAVRNYVYQSIRELDAGHISTTAFKQRLLDTGLGVPHSLDRLLSKQEADGSAKFHEFVRVLDPEIGAHATSSHVANVPFPGDRGDSRESNLSHTPRGSVPMAQQSHGDVIAWQHGPSKLEEHEVEMAVRGRRQIELQRKQELYKYGATNMLHWDTEGKSEGSIAQEKLDHAARRHYTPSTGVMPSSGDIITWAGAAAPPNPPPSSSNRYSPRRTSKYAAPFGTDADLNRGKPHAYAFQVPFGTEADM